MAVVTADCGGVCASQEFDSSTPWSDKWWYFGSAVSTHSVTLCFTMGLTTWQTATTEHTLPHLRTLSWNTPGHEFPLFDSSSSAAVCDRRVISGLELQFTRQTSPARVSPLHPECQKCPAFSHNLILQTRAKDCNSGAVLFIYESARRRKTAG